MRKKKSAILEAVHDTAKGLHRAGVMDQVTLREFDRLCLMPIASLASEMIESLEPEKIK
jgi:putative transcriptional regulator